MRPFEEWTDPDMVGSAEYLAIYELCRDAIEDRDDEEPGEVVKSVLRQFRDWATTLLWED